MLYWLLPRLFQTRLWSTRLAEWHFWLGTLGILLYIVPIYIAGLTQGLMWRAFDAGGNLQYPNFVETVLPVLPMWWARVAGGTLFLGGACLMAVNWFMTWRSRPAVYEVPVLSAPPLTRSFDDPPPPEPRIRGVLEVGRKLDVWSQMVWHRVWERMPLTFTAWVIFAVLLASAMELIPSFLIRSNIPTISTVRPYTPLELAGRDIYVAEGCYNCHSQMIRPIFAETERYGEYSKPGEFIYDRPFQWGSRRIGPDLAREGGRQSHQWHLEHFRNPAESVVGSVMPAYGWLESTELDFRQIQPRVDAAALLGAPYTVERDQAEEIARAQARRIVAELVAQGGPDRVAAPDGRVVMLEDSLAIALIAYLQRLGTDLFAGDSPPAADGTAPVAVPEAGPAAGDPPPDPPPDSPPPEGSGTVPQKEPVR